MPKGAVILAVIVLIFGQSLVAEAKLGGGLIDFKTNDGSSKRVQDAARFALGEIHQKKLQNGEYDKCTTLGYNIKKGSYQQMVATKYELHMKIFPVVSQAEGCAERRNSLLQNKMMPELCEVVVVVQPWILELQNKNKLLKSVCLKIED